MNIREIKEKVVAGQGIDKAQAMFLYEEDLGLLCQGANEIRQHFMGDDFEVCSIINAKSGSCGEDCKFCAQSIHYSNKVAQFGLLDKETIFEDAKKKKEAGVNYYSIVTAGRRLSKEEVLRVGQGVKMIKDRLGLGVCVSLGVLDIEDYRILKEMGVERVHNNLETSQGFFPSICSSHTFEQKVQAIQAAQRAGLEVCSGGLIGLGESREDRVDLALSLRELGIRSTPVNLLHPIKGTPFEEAQRLPQEEILRTFAVFRFILPNSLLRLAGGRALIEGGGADTLSAGVNAAITGDFLNTAGINMERDRKMITEAGFTFKSN